MRSDAVRHTTRNIKLKRVFRVKVFFEFVVGLAVSPQAERENTISMGIQIGARQSLLFAKWKRKIVY